MTKKVCRTAAVALWMGIAGWTAAAAAPSGEEARLAKVAIGGSGVEWLPQVAGYDRLVLRVSGPGGLVVSQEFKAGTDPALSLFDAQGQALPDGGYTWELHAVPRVSPALAKQLAAAHRDGDDAAAAALQRSAGLGSPLVETGHFAVAGGALVTADLAEPRKPRSSSSARRAAGTPTVSTRDQVIADDLIVQGSACIGLDCVNNESFGFDTIRLKENNTRIKFDDTSTGTGFPNHDWQLTANDSASGGANKFSIEDITAATVPFTITGSAPTNSVFVDSSGRVGFRTSTPVLDLHVATSNTPAMRLEQNNSGGFTAQTWDIAGNEANFFVRDVTGGSRLPFRIRPGAPTSSIDISASGNVGVGTASPSRSLDISRAGVVDIGLQNTSGTSVRWFLQTDNDTNHTFKLSREGGGGTVVTVDARLDANGVTFKVDGSIQATNVVFSSSRELKTEIAPLDARDVLARLVMLPIAEWRFKTDKDSVRHIGPMAEDFQQAFGLGADSKHISTVDANGIALAAIQGLNAELKDKDREIAELRARIETLEGLLRPAAK